MGLQIDVFDEVGIGGGASGISGGLLHPYSPKVKLLWRGEECWNECLSLFSVAEQTAVDGDPSNNDSLFRQRDNRFIVRRSGILRPAISEKYLDIMHQNAENSLASCQIQTIDRDAATHLVPNLCTPLNASFFIPKAVNVNPQCYLQALFLACQKSASTMLESGHAQRSLLLHKKSIASLNDLAGEYNVVIICLGAKVKTLPELSGLLPLRTCRGIIAHLQLPDTISGLMRVLSTNVARLMSCERSGLITCIPFFLDNVNLGGRLITCAHKYCEWKEKKTWVQELEILGQK